MANLKVDRAIFAFAFIITVFLLAPVYAADSSYLQDVFFLGIKTDQARYSAGSNLTLETTVVNEGPNPQANMTLYYKINRKNDSATIFSGSEGIELASREARVVKKAIGVPSRVLPGKYEVSIELVGSSGTPISSIFQAVTIDSDLSQTGSVLFIPGEFYLKAPITQIISEGITETKTKYLYGLVGDTIPNGNPLSVHFSLSNPSRIGLDISARIKIVPSYSKTGLETEQQIIEESLGIIEPGANKTSLINFSINGPGTYSVVLAIYSKDSLLCQKEIRAVISGEDGTILDIKNSKGTYKNGESVKIGVSFVGPADKSTIEGSYIQLKIKSGGREIKSLKNSPIILSSRPGLTEFNFNAPEDMKDYDLEIELGKGSAIFDSVVQSYSPMGPNMTITEDGRIVPSNKQGCFDDGICAEIESGFGDCIDCQPMNKTVERQETEKYEFYKNASFVLLGVILLLLIIIWWYKR